MTQNSMTQIPTDRQTVTAASERRLGDRVLALLYVLSFGGLAWLTWYGWDYYSTPLIERPHHALYWSLKPGGSLGRLYGVVGASLMTLMMSYSLRKRVRVLAHLGQLRHWLDFHIYCGVVGPLFITLHSSLKVTGVVALSFWSMVVVAASGILGRYLYLQIPRRRSGDEMTLAEIEQAGNVMGERLMEDFGVGEEVLERIEGLASSGVDSSTGLLRVLVGLPLSSARLKWRVRELTRSLTVAHRSELQRLVLDRALLSRRILLWDKLQELFHHWHVLHKPFAIIMYLFAAVHIGVAIATGYAFSS